MKISVASSPETKVDFVETEVNSVRDIADIACKSDFSTATFQDDKRNIANFIQTQCMALDIDNDKGMTLSVEQAKRLFGEYKHLIMSTRNHNKDKNGVVAERFRVVLFLEHPITNQKDYYSTWFYLKGEFPWIDSACKDPARLWYNSHEVLSLREVGKLITPIRFSEPERPLIEGREALPGERGEISKQTLQWLEFGIQKGSRNGSVYKIAREFQQALYPFEETKDRIIQSLERNKILTNDFTVQEVDLAVRSAFSKETKHAPRLGQMKPRAFTYQRVGDLLNAVDQNEDWLVDGIILKGGVSCVVGMPKIGKTTLVRQLEKCILRGDKFLERKTQKGSVVHYSFDEKARTAKRHYKTLGLTSDDNMILHFGSANNDKYLSELEEDLIKIKPSIAVVDTLFDMIDVQDVNSYGPIKKQLSAMSTLAEKTNCHIMFIHHTNKPNLNYGQSSGHSVLGSTAIYGSVDCLLIFEQVKDSVRRTIKATGRGVDNFDRTELSFDPKSMTYTIFNENLAPVRF